MKHRTLCALFAVSAAGCSSGTGSGGGGFPSGPTSGTSVSSSGTNMGTTGMGASSGSVPVSGSSGDNNLVDEDASVGDGTDAAIASRSGSSSGTSTSGTSSTGSSGSSGAAEDDASTTSSDASAKPPPSLSSCPAPPSGASANTVMAWQLVNQIRLAAGSTCMNVVATLDKSAQSHCNYEAANASNASCTSDPHGEVMSCMDYTGPDVQSREVAAGYPQALAYTEVLTTFGNNPTLAVPNWIDTVFHRIPLLDPWTTDMGYGGATGCDVIDIGRGMSNAPATTIVTYPYDGQTNVPPAWNGLEGPEPPMPTGGFPSSYPINIYAQSIKVTQHVLTKDGDSTPIDHVWLDISSSNLQQGLQGYFFDTAFLYGAPFAVSTKYHVKIVGTYAGGTLDKEWSFTTAATRPFGT